MRSHGSNPASCTTWEVGSLIKTLFYTIEMVVKSTPICTIYGALAQLGERVPCLIDLQYKTMNTKQIGNLTELQCITRLYELGYSVSVPYGDSEKYDFILDCNGELYRLQCKHANIHTNQEGIVEYITIKTTWQSGYTKHSSYKQNQYTKKDCDFFITYYENKSYLIPVEQCSNTKTLRIMPPKNGQIKGVSFLKDFIDEEVLKKL